MTGLPQLFILQFHLENGKWTNPSGLPPHELVLKVGYPCISLRNLNPPNDSTLADWVGGATAVTSSCSLSTYPPALSHRAVVQSGRMGA
ncbi:hypothetical protein EVAR_71482_1 [Eumeta japonica]|uniref:DNA helicase Pif1-like 2B domain-containing protein n=1 Tax=Eumeta variegata TaxID=151549 RepID=A0A4C1SPR3_EUMVA|nr:hypothetical protein EVAR_71482_1 [Eumeta japonica]